MEQDLYRVEVLHHLDPHLIWIEVIKNGEIVFEQIGLYGILPLEPSLHCDGDFTCNVTDQWVPAVNNVMRDFFNCHEEIWFCPIHIDRRTSIFDNNIHKFGDLVIKAGNSEVSLTRLVVQSNLGLHDVSQFHQRLSCGAIKTKLSRFQTISVIEHLVSYYNKSNKQRLTWKTALKKQTSIYNASLELETLTTQNLQRHNDYLSRLKILEDKLDDLSMCKDFDEPSLGRASTKPKVKSSRSSVLLEKKLKLARDEYKVPNNNSTQVLKDTKEFLDKYGMKMQQPNNDTIVNNIDDNVGKSEKVNENGIVNIDKNTIGYKNTTNVGKVNSLPESFNYEGRHKDIDKKYIKELKSADENDTFENNRKVFEKSRSNTPPKDEAASSVKNEDIKENVNRNHKEILIAFGPPEFNRSKLPLKKRSIIVLDDDTAVAKSEELEMPERNMFDNEEDPEAGFDLTKLSLKVNCNVGSESYKNCDNSTESDINTSVDAKNNSSGLLVARKYSDNSTGSETSTQVNRKKNSSNLLLNRKLKQHMKHIEKLNSSLTSDSDTTNKDSSSLDGTKPITNKGNIELNSDDDISDVVKELNLQNVIVKKEDNIKETDASCNQINVNPFKNLEGSRSVFVDKLVSPILMVHTKKNNKIQPYTNLRDVPFGTEIQTVLRNMSIKEPTRMQSVSWHTILRGHSVFMIGSLGCGKTMGYLPSVCRLVSYYHTNKNTAGPSCIIVCGTAQSVSEVERASKMFLGLKEKVLACYVGVDELDLTMSLLNGCDLLICMPSFLTRLMHNEDFGIDLRSLKTFVMDDCERLFDVYAKEMKFIVYNIKEMIKNRANKEVKVQFVAASRKWSDSLSTIAKTAPDSVICIGAFQECILYAKSSTIVSFVKNDNKINETLTFLQDVDGPKKTVIVCRFDDEVKYLVRHLKQNKCVVFACDNTMTVQDLYNINISWGNYQEPTVGPILICCDENLSHMNVTDAHYLLHYSLPSLFSTFCKRFSVLNDNYPSIFKTDSESVKVKVLLEERNVEQLPKILNFIKRCTVEVPDVLDEVAKKVLAQKDLLKATKFVPLCDSFLALGICPDFWNCQERHKIFKDYDTPKEWVPKEGEVRFKILHYHTAVSFSARLLSNIVNGETKKYPQTYSTLLIKLGMYFSKEKNRKPHGIPKVGDVCAVAVKQNSYIRCQVLKILNHYQSGKPNYVLIKLIDEEKLEKTRDIYLYHLPDDLRSIETHVVNIRLSNVKPIDRDITFSGMVKNRLKKLTDENEEMFMRGQIVLTVGNSVFVDTLEACQDLCSFNEIVVRHNFKQELLDAHALVNDEHISILKELCRKSNLSIISETVTDEAVEKVLAPTMPKGDWAHLDSEELTSVYLSYAENPDKFFLRHVKFESCMNSLLKDIEKHVRDNPSPVTEIKQGDMVLAKFPDDDKYERARINNIIDDSNVECFFVDQGDWHKISTKHLLPITETIIKQLPYQAIECRLAGVKPAGSEWTEYSNNWFSDNCFEDGSGNMKQLFAKYYTKEVAEYTEGHKYGVVIIDTNTDRDVVINLVLVELNLAGVNENEIYYFNAMNTTYNKCDKDDLSDENEAAINLVKHSENVSDEIKTRELKTTSVRKSKFDFDMDDDDALEYDFEMNVDDNVLGLFKTSVPNWLSKEVKVNFPSIVTSEGKIIRNGGDELSTPRLKITELPNDTQTTGEMITASTDNSQIKIEEMKNDPYRKPKLFWRQTKTSVTIKIILIGVERYDLEIKEKSIRFSTSHNNTDYGFEVELYGIVDRKNATHSNKGQYILINMSKLMKKNWLALTKDCDVKKWIVYDVDSLDASSDEEEINDNTLAEVVKRMHERDESDSEDEDFRDDTKFAYN